MASITSIAKDLGLSEATVSRALSGKGRVSLSTRAKVQQYADEVAYVPNSIAQSLVASKSYNIAFVTTGPLEGASFFWQCLEGVCKQASEMMYDVLIIHNDNENKELKRIITKRKADGIILTRESQAAIELSRQYSSPLILLGQSDDNEVNQVDTDIIKAGEELTRQLFALGLKKVAYIGGLQRYNINRRRLQGFTNALDGHSGPIFVWDDVADGRDIEAAVKEAAHSCDCIITNDDAMCLQVADCMRRNGAINKFGKKVRLATFYYDSILDIFSNSVIGINHNAQELGKKAAHMLISILKGSLSKTGNKSWVDYSITGG